jgi:parvulin-like peptidyl-prolyl isomerase
VSTDQGRKGTSGKGRGAKASGPVAARRLGLAIFGVAFVVLFVVVAVSEGLGDPSIPSGDVILVKDVPGDIGNIDSAEVDHALEITAAQAGEKTPPKPGDPKYEEAKENALKFLLEGVWLQGQAAEWGVEVTEQEVAQGLKKIKKESFKSEAEFQKFLKESHYTPADVHQRVKIQLLGTKLQEELKEKAPTPSQSEIEAYYEAAKATQFTQKSSRDVREIINRDRGKAEEALQALGKDNSAENWGKVAKKFSEEATTKNSGGLSKGLTEETVQEPLRAAFFNAPEGQVEGPLAIENGYVVFEVVNSTPESVQELKTVESQIQTTLAQRLEQEYLTNFIGSFTATWTQRTFCADGYVIERCANYRGSGHPSTAPEGCFEANPKGGPPEACPAPVAQLIPAVPGTVTPLEPKGKPLAQRPRPMEEKGKGAGAEGELPPGAVPPTGEAPPSE